MMRSDRFRDDFPGRWHAEMPGAATIAVLAALIERDGRLEEHYGWLKIVLGRQQIDGLEFAAEEQFRDYVLDALLSAPGEAAPGEAAPGDAKTRLRRIAERAAIMLSSRVQREGELSDIIISELHRRLDFYQGVDRGSQSTGLWEVVAAIEDSGLLLSSSDSGTLAAFKTAMPWVGAGLDGAERIDIKENFETKLNLDRRPQEGGHWFRLELAKALTVRVDNLPDGLEVVVMDVERAKSLHRSSGSRQFQQRLQGGSYALALRLPLKTDQSQKSEIVLYGSGCAFAAGEKETALPVSASSKLLFESGQESGEGWIAIDLDEGDYLNVWTSRASDGECQSRMIKQVLADAKPSSDQEIDTYLRLIDRETGDELTAPDDDGGGGVFSQMSYIADRARPVLVNLATYEPGDRFLPGQQVSVQVDLADRENILEAGADHDGAPTIGMNAPVFVHTTSEGRWVRFSPPTTTLYGIASGEEMEAFDVVDHLGQPVVSFSVNDVSSGTGVQEVFPTEAGHDYFMSITAADDFSDLTDRIIPLTLQPFGTVVELAEGQPAQPISTDDPALLKVVDRRATLQDISRRGRQRHPVRQGAEPAQRRSTFATSTRKSPISRGG